jgi:hypothetical protein
MRVPLRRARGIRALLPALAGAFVAILLSLASPPADAGAVQAGRSRSATSAESVVSSLLGQAEEIEAELAQTPGDEGLLADLTRTRITTANTMITNGSGDSKSGVEEVKQQLVLAGVAWSQYLKVARKPIPELATLVAPALFQLAELSSNSQEALKNVKAAAAAQKIITESRPSKVSWSTLALYDLFAQNHKAADASFEKAISYMRTQWERESFEKKFAEVERNAKRFGKTLTAR